MIQTPIYLDNHATTRVDPRVLEAMLPFFTEDYGNAGSATHAFGWQAKETVENARKLIATLLGARTKEIVFTSGATESNNLAIQGVVSKYGDKGNHIISVATEHASILAPLKRLRHRGFDITLLKVKPAPDDRAGIVLPEQVAEAIRKETILVTIMLANHEIGVIQPLAEIGAICKERDVLLHCDATQAVGKIPVDVQQLHVDLMSFSAHKMYGPKGIGGLYVRRRNPRVRLMPLFEGGGQEIGLRSGTLNVPSIVGLVRALELCIDAMPDESNRLRGLRNQFYEGLVASLPDVGLNGPSLDLDTLRLPGNLNMSFAGIDGESLLMSMKDLAASTGSACTSANSGPSHVLQSLSCDEPTVRGSLRFGLGRFNTAEEVTFCIDLIVQTVSRLRRMSSLR